jgi:creatinine amidohydrolase/Fe(II)-dependent formamide hydrolase-like protein
VVEAIREARQDIGIEACCVLTRDVLGRLALTGQEPYVIVQETPLFLGPAPKYAEVHAGGCKTSAMLAYFPDQVDVELARTLKPTELDWGDVARWVHGGQTAREMASLGYVGGPANLIVKDAKEYIEASARMCAEAIVAYLKAERP